MRVLVASDSFPPKIDGVSDTAATIARVLGALGHTVRVIAPAPGPTELGPAKVARLGSVPAPFYPELRLAWEADRIVRIARGRWDGAIVLTPGPIGATFALSLEARTPLLTIYTTDIPRYLQAYGMHRLVPAAEWLLRRMAGRSVRTLCPTAFVRDELARRGFPRLEIWGRGVDTALFNPNRRSATMRERLAGGEPGKPVVLYVGRLAREKRVDLLGGLFDHVPGMRLAIVGDGPERGRLEALFSGRPVTFTGYLRGVELAEAFASADLFVFPSATDTFGQVVLQAMACGLPPVVVGGSATAELVTAGICGLHVAPGRAGALGGAVRRLVEDEGLRRSMGLAASEYARRFSWEALVGRLVELLAPGATAGRVEVPGPFAK